MYWKIAEEIDEHGTKWYIYNYYEIIDIPTSVKPYYNGILQKYVYPEDKHLVVKVKMDDDEEHFKS